MKHLLNIVFFLACFLPLRSQTDSSGLLVVKNNDYNFGEIMQDHGEVQHTFIIKNTGKKPFSIINVRATCQCTNPIWPKSPVMPGKEGKIIIHFDPRNYVGAFEKTLQLLSTAKNSNMFLTIHGVVIPPNETEKMEYHIGDLGLQSKQLNLGYVYKGDLASKSMLIKNMGKHPLEIELQKVPPYIDAFVKPSVLKPEEYGRIEVYFHTSKTDQWDVVMKKLDVVINGKKNDNSRLAVTANIREDFSKLTPEQLLNAPVAVFPISTHHFDTLKGKKPVTCKFLLQNKGKSKLIIHAVIPSCGCTAAEPEKPILKPGETTYIHAKFDPEGWEGKFSKVITVITNDPKNYKQYLWIKGFVKP